MSTNANTNANTNTQAPTRTQHVLAGVAAALLLAMAPFFVASGLLAPLWAVIVLGALWVALAGLTVIWFRAHPLRVLPLPVVAAVVWVGGISLGEALLGWTA